MLCISLSDVSLIRPVKFGHSYEDRLVLNKICIEIEDGERVGIIGENGSGKTTLLRVMAGVFTPDGGLFNRNGDTRSFFDMGFGWEIELTGRENTYSRSVIDAQPMLSRTDYVNWVGEFSELGDHFDKPLKTYSAGMLARLAFSMCTFGSPQVLLIDEGIGTVDSHFRKKALRRLNEIYGEASVLVLATHDDSLLKQLCTRGVVIHKGKIQFDGTINDALSHNSTNS